MKRPKPKPQYFSITEVTRRTGYCANHLRVMTDTGELNVARNDQGQRLFTAENIAFLIERRERREAAKA